MSDFFVTPWTVACQASLSMGFSRQEYWSEWPFPSRGDLPDPGIELHLLHWEVGSLLLSHQVVVVVVVYLLSRVGLLQPCGPQHARLLCPWDFPGKNTGVSGHFLLHRMFPTQESNPGLLHCRQIPYRLSYLFPTGKLIIFIR